DRRRDRPAARAGRPAGRGAEPRGAVQERRRRAERARHRRAGDTLAPQDRARSRLPALPAHGAWTGLPAGERVSRFRDLSETSARWADRPSPQTLFARALIIIVVPMLLLQALSAWWFYSQRGDNVTNRLALLLVRDLRFLVAMHADFPDDEHRAWIVRHAR